MTGNSARGSVTGARAEAKERGGGPAPASRQERLRLDAARAVLRLTQAARGAFGNAGQRDAAGDGPVSPEAFALLAAPMAEADEALRAAGFTGSEAELYRLVGALRSHEPGAVSGREPGVRGQGSRAARSRDARHGPGRRTDL